MEAVKVSLMGLRGVGGAYLDALCNSGRFELVAVADTDRPSLHAVIPGAGVARYDDYRSLVVESAQAGACGVVVLLEPHASLEFVEMAASYGLSVLHKSPFARSVDEARRVLKRFSVGPAMLVASRPWRFDTALSRLSPPPALAGYVYAVRAHLETSDSADGWRGDSARSGGGVLLHGAYEIVDLLIGAVGVPESVFAYCGTGLDPGRPRRYDTEDAVAVSLRFAQGCIASVSALRGAPDDHWYLHLTGTEAVIEANSDGMTITPAAGGPPIRLHLRTAPREALELEHFADLLMARSPQRHIAAEEPLGTLAVIEAAYLSARTHQPESPAQFLHP